MGITSRRKGANGEREFSKLIEAHTGIKLERILEQWRSGGHDLHANGFPFALEIKRHRNPKPGDVAVWWNQAEVQAETAKLLPALAYRGDRKPWRVVVPLCALSSDLCKSPGFDWTAELSVLGFCHLVRELS